MSGLDTRVIQVTNVAPTTTKDQLKTLFQFIGRIRDVKLFPPEGSDQQVAAKVCYVEFEDSTSAGVALHLTNTVFIDRALIVVPVMDGRIPDERVAAQLTPQTVARMGPSQPTWPASVVSQLTGIGMDQVITTYDPQLNARGLPQYPPLPATLDAGKVEEVRRTVYIGNLDPKTTAENLISFFSQAGEVKYVRMAGEDTSISRAAYLELTDQRSVANYLSYNGVTMHGRPITVSHARSSINKPLAPHGATSGREVEEAMKKVQEAQSLISAAAAEKFVSRSRSKSRKRSRSRSRSRSKRRSRSRSRGRRRRSRSRSRRKSKSPRRVRRSRSRSPRRRTSRSRPGFVNAPPARERKRSRSASRPRRRSRSKRRSRTPPKSYAPRRSRSRSKGVKRKSRSRSPRRSRSRSRGKGRERRDKGGKEAERKKKERKASSRSLSPPTLRREGNGVRHSGDSPAKLDPSEASGEKKASQKRDRSESPPRGNRKRSQSRSPVKASRRRSISPRKRRSKSRSPRRSRSPAKKKKARSPRRSRSGSRHRSKKDKKKERSRSKERREKKKKNKERKEEKKEPSSALSSSNKVVPRNYDEEEKGYNSGSDREEVGSQGGGDQEEEGAGGANRQLVDMETSD